MTSSFRRRRKQHLRPLLNAPFADVFQSIQEMPKQSARALLRVMDELSETNCWWVEYQFARLYRPLVVQRLERKK